MKKSDIYKILLVLGIFYLITNKKASDAASFIDYTDFELAEGAEFLAEEGGAELLLFKVDTTDNDHYYNEKQQRKS